MPPLDSVDFQATSYIDRAIRVSQRSPRVSKKPAKPAPQRVPRPRQVISRDQSSIDDPTPLRAAVCAARAALLDDAATPVWSLARTLPVIGLIDFCKGQPADAGVIRTLIELKSHECGPAQAAFRSAVSRLVYRRRVERCEISDSIRRGLLDELSCSRQSNRDYHLLRQSTSYRLKSSIQWLREGIRRGERLDDSVMALVSSGVDHLAAYHDFSITPSILSPAFCRVIIANHRRSHEGGAAVCAAADNRCTNTTKVGTALAKKGVIRKRLGLTIDDLRGAVAGDIGKIALVSRAGLDELERVLPYVESAPESCEIVRWLDRRIHDLSLISTGLTATLDMSSLNTPVGDGDTQQLDLVPDRAEKALTPEEILAEKETVTPRRATLLALLDAMADRIGGLSPDQRTAAAGALPGIIDEGGEEGWLDVVAAGTSLLSILKPASVKPVTVRVKPAVVPVEPVVTKSIEPAIVPVTPAVTKSIEPASTPIEPAVTKQVQPASTPVQPDLFARVDPAPAPVQLDLPLDLPVFTPAARPKRARPARAAASIQPDLLYIISDERTDPDPHRNLCNPNPGASLAGVVQSDRRPGYTRLPQNDDQPTLGAHPERRERQISFAIRPLPIRRAVAESWPGRARASSLLDMRPPSGIRPGRGPPDRRDDVAVRL